MEVLVASVPVADLQAALGWYVGLFGRSADIVPNQNEVMWCVAGNGWLYVVEDPERAGHTVVTISVSDLDQFVADLASRGISAGTIVHPISSGVLPWSTSAAVEGMPPLELLHARTRAAGITVTP